MAAETKEHVDPLIDDVRSRRRAIWDECEHDFDKLRDLLRQYRAEHPERIVERGKRNGANKKS